MANKKNEALSVNTTRVTAALGLPVMASALLVAGCSGHKDVTTVTEVTSTAVQAGGSESDAARKTDCQDLVDDITKDQITLARKGAEDYQAHIQDIIKYGTTNPNNSTSPLAARHANKALAIAVEAVPDPHSKAVKQKVKDFCGSENFEEAVSKTTKAQENSKYGTPFTPDWSL